MTAHPSIQVRDYREVRRNTLLGFVTVELPSGLILYEVSVHEKNGACWASPAGRDKFSKAVIAAVRQQHPEALA